MNNLNSGCRDRCSHKQTNKSNRTTMRPLGVNLIGISIYVLNMIHFMMILVNFGVFSLRHAENWDVICYPPIYHPRNSEYGKWSKFSQKEKKIRFIHCYFWCIWFFFQNSLHLKLDLNAFKCKEFWIMIENTKSKN